VAEAIVIGVRKAGVPAERRSTARAKSGGVRIIGMAARTFHAPSFLSSVGRNVTPTSREVKRTAPEICPLAVLSGKAMTMADTRAGLDLFQMPREHSVEGPPAAALDHQNESAGDDQRPFSADAVRGSAITILPGILIPPRMVIMTAEVVGTIPMSVACGMMWVAIRPRTPAQTNHMNMMRM
jgi:hypothetical protein